MAPLSQYIKLALPLVKEDGLILSMLGEKKLREILGNICQKYPVSIAECKSFILPFSSIKREIVAFKKI